MLSSLKRNLLKQWLLFFLYGATANLGIGILVVRRLGESSILSQSSTFWIVALTAGMAFGVWMVSLLRRAANDAGDKGWGLIAGAGLRGILSTALAMILLSIIEAIAFDGRLHSGLNWPSARDFLYLLMETSTYGMGRVMIGVPFGFAYGAIGGIYLRSVVRRGGSKSYAVAPRGDARKGPLVWSVVGLLFVMVPVIGTACSTVGLVQGALDLRGWNREGQGTRTVPLTAVVIGCIGVLWFLLSLFVYVMAGHGWFRAHATPH
jgi:hypothetical protein